MPGRSVASPKVDRLAVRRRRADPHHTIAVDEQRRAGKHLPTVEDPSCTQRLHDEVLSGRRASQSVSSCAARHQQRPNVPAFGS
jgi:hypothetical protein